MRFWGLLTTVLPFAMARPESHSRDSSYFFKGHDLSSLLMLEQGGSIFKDTLKHNATRPAEAILGDGGMNSVRLRQWVDPSTAPTDSHTISTSPNPPPAAWPTELKALSKTLRAYVKDTLISFKKAGIKLDIVALGNEIRHGMLWPVGYVDVDIQPTKSLHQNFTSFATLWKSARAGVDDALAAGVQKPQIMIHIDDGWNVTLQQRWFDALTANGVPLSAWDVFGFSFYPFYGTAATLENLRTTLHWVAETYRKPVHVAETDYPAICDGQYNPIPESSEPEIPYTVAGQLEWTEDVISVVRNVPHGLGRGVHYWEPAWLNNTSLGSDCNDAILFAPDYSAWPTTVGYSRKSVALFK
ncbi:glycosyl hydrolase family 53 [Botrytis cinerea]